jgi:hypothetical protein
VTPARAEAITEELTELSRRAASDGAAGPEAPRGGGFLTLDLYAVRRSLPSGAPG